MKSIEVEPPTNDARRDRVERQVFRSSRNMRAVERADAAVPTAPVVESARVGVRRSSVLRSPQRSRCS